MWEVSLQEMEFAIPANLHPSADLCKAASKEKVKSTAVGNIPKDWAANDTSQSKATFVLS